MFYTEHGLPLSEDKQWVASRYEKSRENDERYRNVVPLNEEVLSLHLRREPRFYADIAAHGTYWYKKTVGGGNEPLYCNCLQGQRMGTSSKNYDIQTPQNLTGYYIKKFDNADVAFKDYYSNGAYTRSSGLSKYSFQASAEANNKSGKRSRISPDSEVLLE